MPVVGGQIAIESFMLPNISTFAHRQTVECGLTVDCNINITKTRAVSVR